MAERLEREWNELRQHVSVDKDPQKVLLLTAELERRKLIVDAGEGERQLLDLSYS